MKNILILLIAILSFSTSYSQDKIKCLDCVELNESDCDICTDLYEGELISGLLLKRSGKRDAILRKPVRVQWRSSIIQLTGVDGNSYDFRYRNQFGSRKKAIDYIKNCELGKETPEHDHEETVTTLINNGDGTATYTNEEATATTFQLGWTTVTPNADGSYTFTYPDGATDEIPADCCPTLGANTDGSFTFTAGDGSTLDIPAETVTTLVDNGDGSFSYTNEDGIVSTYSEKVTTLITNADGSITYTSEDGTVTTYGESTTVISLGTDNTSIDYLDEDGNTTNLNLCDIVDNCETLTSLTFNPTTNTITYVDENGDSNDIILSGGNTSIVTDANTNTSVQTIATHDDGGGTVVNIEETVTTLVDNGDGTYTNTSENGTVTVIDIGEVVVLPNGTPPATPPSCINGYTYIIKDSTECVEIDYIWTGDCAGGTWEVIDYDSLEYNGVDLTLTWKMLFESSYVAEADNPSNIVNYLFEYTPYHGGTVTQPVNNTNWVTMQNGASPLLNEFLFPNVDTSYLIRLTATDVCGRTYTAYDEPTFNMTAYVNPRSIRQNSHVDDLREMLILIRENPYKATLDRGWDVYVYDHSVSNGSLSIAPNLWGDKLTIHNEGRIEWLGGSITSTMPNLTFSGQHNRGNESDSYGWYFDSPPAVFAVAVSDGGFYVYNEKMYGQDAITIRTQAGCDHLGVYDSHIETNRASGGGAINLNTPSGEYRIFRNTIISTLRTGEATDSGTIQFGDSGSGADVEIGYNTIIYDTQANNVLSGAMSIKSSTADAPSDYFRFHHNDVRCIGTSVPFYAKNVASIDWDNAFIAHNVFQMEGLGTNQMGVRINAGTITNPIHFWNNTFYNSNTPGSTVAFGGAATYSVDPTIRTGSNEAH